MFLSRLFTVYLLLGILYAFLYCGKQTQHFTAFLLLSWIWMRHVFVFCSLGFRFIKSFRSLHQRDFFTHLISSHFVCEHFLDRFNATSMMVQSLSLAVNLFITAFNGSSYCHIFNCRFDSCLSGENTPYTLKKPKTNGSQNAFHKLSC